MITLLSSMTLHSALVKREFLIVSMVSTTISPNHTPVKKVYLQGSRKKGCKAHISIVEFNLYPEYSIKQSIPPGVSQNKVRKIREESLSELRKSIESGNPPLVKNKFFVSLPNFLLVLPYVHACSRKLGRFSMDFTCTL